MWVPESGARLDDVASAARLAPDPRIMQLWDASGVEPIVFRAPLHLEADAWDVYLAYPPGVRWEGATPPAPAFAMQQLDALSESDVPFLDGDVFAAHVRALLPALHK